MTHQFLAKYANTPLEKRKHPIVDKKGGVTTLNNIYFQVKELEDKMMPDVIKRDRLINLAHSFWEFKI